MFNKIKEYYETKKGYRIETYKKMLSIILKNVETTAYNEKTVYVYEIPEFVLGEPTYDITECAEYLVRKLKDYKFKDVSFYKPSVIYIEWEI